MRCSRSLLPALLLFVSVGTPILPARAQTPRALWEKRVVKAPAVPPTLSGDTLWVVGTDRKIRSHDARTGQRHWKKGLPGHAVVPVLATAELLILGLGYPEPSVVALDRYSGKEVWGERVGREVAGLAVAGGSVFSATIDGRVEARGVTDGSLIWRRDLGAAVAGLAVTPEELVILGRRDSLRCVESSDGSDRWSVAIDQIHAAGPRIVGSDLLRVSYDGTLVVHDLGSGEVRARAAVTAPQISVPIVAEELLATAATGGEIEVRSFPSLEKRWSSARKETVAGAIAAWGSWWIIPTQAGRVLALVRSRGSTAWSLTFGEPITWRAAASERYLALSDEKGRLVVYTLEGF